MSVLANLRRLPRWVGLQAQRFKRDAAGIAAVEFAMMAPVMIIMMVGCVETSDALTVSGRMVNISGAVADMVARCQNIETQDLNDIMTISDALLGRYPRWPLYIKIVDVQSDALGNMTVAWSYDKSGGHPLAAGAPYVGLPPGLISPSSSIIVATSSYKYRSPMGWYIHGYINLSHTAYNAPRGGPVQFDTTPCKF